MTTVQDYLKKAIENAEKAVAEDKEKNYKAAVQHYTTAVDCLMQAMQYEGLSAQRKQTIRSKVESYIKRAEELTDILKNNAINSTEVVDSIKKDDNSTDTKNANNNNGDRDTKSMAHEFQEAIITNSKISFADVIGLEQAKEALKEAVILPVKFPQLFLGARKSATGILLYGPPGAGKSYLAKAIATECACTFIYVHASDFMSRWCNDNERKITFLFQFARERQPCIVFIDDIDVLCSEHNDTEAEWLKRVKTEFLIQMHGIERSDTSILVLAASIMPWTLDASTRRRFDKRIYIPLPGVNERADMFKTYLGTNTFHTIKDHEWMELAQKTEGYSNADIVVVCREAVLRPIRRLRSSTHFKRGPNPKAGSPREIWLACSPEDPAAVPITLDQIELEELCEPPVTMSDMLDTIATTKPTVEEEDVKQYVQFIEDY